MRFDQTKMCYCYFRVCKVMMTILAVDFEVFWMMLLLLLLLLLLYLVQVARVVNLSRHYFLQVHPHRTGSKSNNHHSNDRNTVANPQWNK